MIARFIRLDALCTGLFIALALGCGTALAEEVQKEPVTLKDAGSGAEKVYAVDIPSRPLPEAIAELSAQTGLQVLYSGDGPFERSSGAVSGNYTLPQALGIMLKGTGISFRFVGKDAVTLVSSGGERSGGAMEIGPVTVVGSQAGGSAITEGTGSYASSTAGFGSKNPASIRETPQSISVVTRQRIEDQNMTSLDDAMRKTTGMVVLNNDQGRSSIFSRGFELDSFLVDGLPSPLSSIYGSQPELAIYDSVEVLRGPGGLLAGTGEPGGVVNLVRKRALDRFALSGSASYGSWDYYAGEADITGPLAKGGAIRGRLVGAYKDRDTFVDVNHNQAIVGYGTLEFDLDDATTLSLAFTRQERDITPFNGLPAYTTGQLLDVRRSTFIGADWNRFDNASNEGFLELERRFGNGGHAKLAARYVDRTVDFKYAYSRTAVDPVTGNVGMTALAREFDEESLALDAHVSSPFELAGLTHRFVAGADYRRYDQNLRQGTHNFGPSETVNVFNPVSNLPEPNINFTTRTLVEPEQFGLYGQAALKPLSPLTFIFGGRLSWYDSRTTNLATSPPQIQNVDVDGKFTPYAGVVYDISDSLSAYVSYAQIFQPQTSLDASGNVLDPRSGVQYEAGLKGEFLDGKFNFQAAVFRLVDENRAIADPVTAGASIASGEVEVQGVETEVSGSPLPGLEVYAGYTFTETEHLSAPAGQEGMVFSTWTPKHNFNLWSRYSFQSGMLNGVHLAGGLKAVSSFYSQSGAVRFEEDGYAIVDAQVGYKFTENLSATLTVNNVFDTEYYTRVGSATVFNFFGEPRSAILNVAARF